MKALLDLFSGHASQYAQYRPDYPQELFSAVINNCPDHPVAADIATGSGQAAQALAPFCQRVIGVDISMQQLIHAGTHARLNYLVSRAENLPFAGGTIDLITVAQALHWMDLSHFNVEVERVLTSKGTLAVWGYAMCSVTPEIDVVFDELYSGILQAYWPPERKWVENGYRDITLPLEHQSSISLAMHKVWTLPRFIGYIKTWSALQQYLRQNTEESLVPVWRRLEKAWGEPNRKRKITWPLAVRICRKS